MATHEVALGFEYLYGALSADATLTGYAPGGIHRGYAPPSTTPPYLIIAFQAGSDNVLFGALRGYSSMLFQAKAVGPAKSTQALVNAASRLDTVITVATETAVTGGVIKACFRFQPLQIDELVDGEQWTNLGGLYRIIAKSS